MSTSETMQLLKTMYGRVDLLWHHLAVLLQQQASIIMHIAISLLLIC